MTDLIVVGVGMRIEQLLGHEQEARGTEPALECASLDEGFLDRIELLAVGQPLHSLHAGAVHE
jgi:hypothetical protein